MTDATPPSPAPQEPSDQPEVSGDPSAPQPGNETLQTPSEPAPPAGDDAPDNAPPSSEPDEQRPAPEPDDAPSADSPDAGETSNGDRGRPDTRDADDRPRKANTLICRYGAMGYLGEFRFNVDPNPRPGQKVVVRTDRGVELAEVLAGVAKGDRAAEGPRQISGQQLNAFCKESGPDYPIRRNGRLLRMANQQDLIDYRHLQDSALDAGKFARREIRERKLPMRLVTVEHLLGGERIVFYFTAENRVDFRDLVRDLASEFCTRIEMRQVGARDEARLVADYERCGQRCCCQQFLKDLKPVSMKMAKIQKATLDPSKISGRCGRPMCCLRYEDKTYDVLRKKLPKRNTWALTPTGVGKVIDTQIITQLVRLYMPDGTIQAVPNEDLLERNLPEPTPEELQQHAANQQRARREAARAKAAELGPPVLRSASPSREESKDADSSGEGGQRKKRRRRRKKKPAGGQGGQQQPQGQTGNAPRGETPGGQSGSAGGEGKDGAPRKKRRRRRRKKKSGDGSQGGAPQGGSGGGS